MTTVIVSLPGERLRRTVYCAVAPNCVPGRTFDESERGPADRQDDDARVSTSCTRGRTTHGEVSARDVDDDDLRAR